MRDSILNVMSATGFTSHQGFHELALRSIHLIMLLVILPIALSVGNSQAAPNQEWETYNGWEVTSFSLEGLPEGLDKDLKGGLGQTGKWKLIGGMQRPEFSVKLLAEDLARIRLFLAQNGYPSANVEPVVVPDSESRQLKLLLRVKPGDPVRIGKIDLNGWPEGVALPDTSDKGILKVGDILRDIRVEEGFNRLKTHLLNSGFATVEMSYALKPMGLGLVAVGFEVISGEFYTISEVEIRGCSEDLMKVAHRVMNIKPGADYSLRLISNASLDLRSTQLFSMVVLEVEPVGPGELKLIAHLENGRMRTLEAGVGTFSDNPWLVRGGWRNRNLFRNGVGFDVLGVVGTHRLGLGAGVNWLGLLSPRARTRAGLGFLVEDEDAYLSHESRLDFIQSFRPRNRDIMNLGLTFSFTDVNRKFEDSLGIPESQGRLMEIWTDVKWDRTNDPLFPTSGGFLKTSVTVAPPDFFSEIPYVSLQGDASVYQSPWDPVVFAGRVRVGWAKPLGEAVAVMATRRFYAGGYNTHRGYGRRKLGPLDAGGNALGGEFVALAGLEVRFPLVWVFDMALFADAGQVWEVPQDATLRGFPLAVGFDLDLRTPLGPLRAGYGWNIANRIDGQPRSIFHFGIGYPW